MAVRVTSKVSLAGCAKAHSKSSRHGLSGRTDGKGMLYPFKRRPSIANMKGMFLKSSGSTYPLFNKTEFKTWLNSTRAFGTWPDSMTNRSILGSSSPLIREPTNAPCVCLAASQGSLSVNQICPSS